MASAGLLPALVLTIWCRRANPWGLVAATVTSLALAAYYLVGTSLYSVTFYETWASLSSAGPEAFLEFEEARDLWLATQGDDRAAAYADLAARTTGSLWSPGIANWFGVAPAAAPALSVPLGLLVGLIVSWATPRPSSRSLAVFDSIHSGQNERLRQVSS
jgi:Na+(H+)/acetate symporter ActP